MGTFDDFGAAMWLIWGGFRSDAVWFRIRRDWGFKPSRRPGHVHAVLG
jgi:hypothetical protein